MEQGFASAMSVAIGSDEGPRGILSVHSLRVRYFDDQEVSFLQSAANVLAAALNQLETEQELRASEERLRLAMEAASLGIWDCDLKTDQITWSRSLALLFGLPADRTCGTLRSQSFDSPRRCGPRRPVAGTCSSGRAHLRTVSHPKTDGTHWIRSQQVFYGNSGGAYRAMGVAMDVSERVPKQSLARPALGRLKGSSSPTPAARQSTFMNQGF